MDKEQFTKAMMLYNTGAISLPEFTEFCMTYIKELEQQVEVLHFQIEDKKEVIGYYNDTNVNLAKAMRFLK